MIFFLKDISLSFWLYNNLRETQKLGSNNHVSCVWHFRLPKNGKSLSCDVMGIFLEIVFRPLPLSIRDGSLSLTSSSSDSLSSQLCGLCLRARRDLEVDMLADAGFSFRSTTHFLSLTSLSYKCKKMTYSINKTELWWKIISIEGYFW